MGLHRTIMERVRAAGGKVTAKSTVCTAFIGTYIPRQCGIGTFTHDLYLSVQGHSTANQMVIAINGPGPVRFEYPPEVCLEMHRDHLEDYNSVADFINFSDADVVCVQHEFGIYGGQAGLHLARLLRNLRKPIVTTLHTVLADSEPPYHRAMQAIAKWSSALVVITEHARQTLIDRYGIDPGRIEVIPHGAPEMPAEEPHDLRQRFHLNGRHVLLTFGLLGPGKGIECAIRSVAAAAAKHPDITYFIVGATHPEVKRWQGEQYRLKLQRLARELNVRQNVVFYNQYVSTEELINFLRACDIYIIPYPNLNQTASGTLAYAMALGNAVVSTPFAHAKEALGEGRGILVEPNSPEGMSKVLIDLLDHPGQIEALKRKAFDYSRHTIWPVVGERYVQLFERVRHAHAQTVLVARPSPIMAREALAEPRFDHMFRLTDDAGILQHAIFRTPNRIHGYCTDDNARAWQVAMMNQSKFEELNKGHLASLYLGYLHFAQRDDGLFHNFMSYHRQWMDDAGSADCQGRTIRALGMAVNCLRDPLDRALARQMFEKALVPARNLTAPRARAYAIVGLGTYLQENSGHQQVRQLLSEHAAALAEAYARMARPGWFWFEDIITYDNARLPEAMLVAGAVLENEKYRAIGTESLKFLTEVLLENGHFSLIGNDGWLSAGGKKSRFDQQPIDAAALVSAYRVAALVLEDDRYIPLANKAMDWFLGDNDLGLSLYDAGTGGCSDGLGSADISANQGAESTLSCLLSLSLISDPTNPRFV